MSGKHTPTPWKFETVKTSCGFVHKIGPFPWNQKSNHACIYVDDDWSWKYGDELHANAARIVHCVNNFDAVVEALRGLVGAVDGLIAESGGVYDLHLNGDNAPWESLVEGGSFEGWLSPLEDAREALALAEAQ